METFGRGGWSVVGLARSASEITAIEIVGLKVGRLLRAMLNR